MNTEIFACTLLFDDVVASGFDLAASGVILYNTAYYFDL